MKPQDQNNFRLIIHLFFISLCLSLSAHAQKRDSINSDKKKTFNALEERAKVSYRLIPLPSYDPSTKWGISIMGMANYYPDKLDTISPPSMSAIMGFATTNGSWGTGFSQNLNLKHDKWRLTGKLFLLNINQVLELGELGFADSKRIMNIVELIGRRRIYKRLYLGLGYSYNGIEYEGRDANSQDKLDLAGFSNKANNHGLKYLLTYDTRDNIFYPYSGVYFEYTAGQNFNGQSVEDPNDFIEHLIDLRQFITLSSNTDHVLAWHIYGRILTGNPTNENYSFYGRSGRMIQRGYEVGSFIDKNMTMFELEYRRETPLMKRKLGFIAFASFGKVFGDYIDFDDAEWLPAIGIGARYRFLEYERMNLKIDLAYGMDDFTLYLGITESF